MQPKPKKPQSFTPISPEVDELCHVLAEATAHLVKAKKSGKAKRC